MSENEENIATTFALVLGILVVFMFAVIIAANMISDSTAPIDKNWTDAEVEKRIAPVGSVYTSGATPPPAEPAPAAAGPSAAVAAPASGSQVYQSACVACHGTGAAGAPAVGDKTAWTGRIAQGFDTLLEHAINGFQGSSGFMPAKGGRTDLSDDAVRAAVEHMLALSK